MHITKFRVLIYILARSLKFLETALPLGLSRAARESATRVSREMLLSSIPQQWETELCYTYVKILT